MLDDIAAAARLSAREWERLAGHRQIKGSFGAHSFSPPGSVNAKSDLEVRRKCPLTIIQKQPVRLDAACRTAAPKRAVRERLAQTRKGLFQHTQPEQGEPENADIPAVSRQFPGYFPQTEKARERPKSVAFSRGRAVASPAISLRQAPL